LQLTVVMLIAQRLKEQGSTSCAACTAADTICPAPCKWWLSGLWRCRPNLFHV